MRAELKRCSEARLAVNATALAALIVLMFPGNAPAQGKWVKLAPFPEPAFEIAGATVNGKIYVFGGLPSGGQTTPPGLVYEYDPGANQWTKKKPMPLPAHHIAAAEYRGKVYLFGGGIQKEAGESNWFPSDHAWEYDPAADSWKALAPMPTKRGAAVAAEVGGKIYVIGGAGLHPGAKEAALSPSQPHRSLGANEAYDPATNTWQTRSPMPTARNHAAIGAVNGKIYVLGGRVASPFIGGDASNTDVVEEYDPATGSWGALRARMLTARSGVGFGTYGGRIYLVGGEFQNRAMAGVFRDLEAYDPAANQWITLPPVPLARQGVGSAVIGNRFHVISGRLQSGGVGPGQAANYDSHDAFEITDK